MRKVVVIGSGNMGVGIAAISLASDYEVVVLGRDRPKVEARFADIRSLSSSINAKHGSGNLIAGTVNDWNDWRDTDLVIETITEQLAIKQALFTELDRRVPETIPIGTNSSGFGVDEISAGLKTADRMLNIHYSMPAHLVPMVEVALGARTELALGQKVCRLIEATGKKTTLIRKYIPGLLISRLQHALMREVLSLIDQGIVTPEDIDAAVRYGFGFRYAALGPIAQKEMSGWDTHLASGMSVYPTLSNVTTPPKCVTELVKAGRIGMNKGAGFESWTEDEVADFKRKYNERLIAALHVLTVAPD